MLVRYLIIIITVFIAVGAAATKSSIVPLSCTFEVSAGAGFRDGVQCLLTYVPNQGWSAIGLVEADTQVNDTWLGDGIAQWIMAIASVFGLFVSAWAVFLVKGTLDATHTATNAAENSVRVSRELGEAQIRAYLYCESARFERDARSLTVWVDICNSGQSPATNLQVEGSLTVYEVGGTRDHSRTLRYAPMGRSESYCPPVFSKGRVSTNLAFFETGDSTDVHNDAEFVRDTFRAANEIHCDVFVRWNDVFGERHEFKAEFFGAIGVSPTNRLRGPAKKGPLEHSMSDPQRVPKAEGKTIP